MEQSENPTKEKQGYEITKMNLLNLQVCSKLPVSEIEAAVNKYNPSGTSGGWILKTEGNLAPVECSKGDGSKHYVFSC